MEAARELTAFVVAHRHEFDDKWVNLFPASIGHATELARYLEIILARYRQASDQWLADQRALEAFLATKQPMEYDQAARHERQVRLHLEIESFYIFAKLFLDRLAMNLYYLFGQAKGVRLGLHHELVQNLERYAASHGLRAVPVNLLASARTLLEDVGDYRDDEIEHARSPRVLKGVGFTRDDANPRLRINIGVLYPSGRDNDRPRESETPVDLAAAIDQYVREMLAYVEANLGRAHGYVGAQSG